MYSSPKESVGSCGNGFEVYGTQGLLASSLDLGWSGLSAQLRTHSPGAVEWKSPKAEREVVVAISPIKSPVTRRFGSDVLDSSIAQSGTAFLCPAEDHLVELSTPAQKVLHIYLAKQHFSADSLGIDFSQASPPLRGYVHSFHDPLVAEIAFAIVSELQMQSAGGKLLAETLALSLAARLVQRSTGLRLKREFGPLPNQGLDRRRLTRVTQYVEANLEGDLTIAELANVACLSRFHFARAFKAAVGKSPYQYVSAHRLERAKELLMRGDRSLLDIAIALKYSSQANFTRAFHRGTGMTPARYRRGFTQYQEV